MTKFWSKSKYTILLLGAAVTINLGISVTTFAASGKCWFDENRWCSVPGNGRYSINDIFAGRVDSDSKPRIADANASTRQAFINFIDAKWNSSNVHDSKGAKFIVQSMRNVRTRAGDTKVDDLAKWKALMSRDDVSITIERDKTIPRTSWYDPNGGSEGNGDFFFDNYSDGPVTRDSVVIKYWDDNNNKWVEWAVIEMTCGNMAGEPRTPPPPDEKIQVCRLSDKKVVTIRKDQLSPAYSTDIAGACGGTIPGAPDPEPQVGFRWGEGGDRNYVKINAAEVPISFTHTGYLNTSNGNPVSFLCMRTTYFQSTPIAWQATNPHIHSIPWKNLGSPSGCMSGWPAGVAYQYNTVDNVGYGDHGKLKCALTQVIPRGYAVAPTSSFSEAETSIPGEGGYENSRVICTELIEEWSMEPLLSHSVNNGATGRYTAAPGDVISWHHSIRNHGPGMTTENIWYLYEGVGLDYEGQSWRNPNGGRLTPDEHAPRDYSYTATRDDLGKSVCRKTRVSPIGGSGNTIASYGVNTGSTQVDRCIRVPYNYILKPHITINADSITAGDSVSVSGGDGGGLFVENSVYDPNASQGTQSRDTDWKVAYLVYKKGVAPSSQSGISGQNDPCKYYSDRESCSILREEKSSPFSKGRNAIQTASAIIKETANELKVGDKVCLSLSVSPAYANPANDVITTDWAHSELSCVTVGAKPFVQAYGHDVVTGAGIEVNKIKRNGITYGSWGEYALLSADKNTNMASARGLYKGNVLNDQRDWSALTGANTYTAPAGSCNTGDFGCFASHEYPTSLISILKALPEARAETCTAGSRTISTNEVPTNGTTKVICATGDIDITAEQKVGSSPGDVSGKISQLIIIGKNITVNQNVGRIDAWLVTDSNAGNIYTCDMWKDKNTQLDISKCSGQLRVNGPVIAGHIFLGRTIIKEAPVPLPASVPQEYYDYPAEAFNLHASTYAWAVKGNDGNPTAETVNIRELPPRY